MILIAGAGGQMGHCFQEIAQQFPRYSWLFADAATLDITSKRSINDYLNQHPTVRWCINCAAYTAVDKAESEPELSYKINVTGARNLAQACAKRGIQLIHFSSDYVYHSNQNYPFVETDSVHPKGVYAKTKLAGEKAVLKILPTAMIVRTSWVYSVYGHNFVKTMLRLSLERPVLKVVFDQIGSLTYGPDLAKAMVWVIQCSEKDQLPVGGIWHYSNEGVCSWYDVAQSIMALKGRSCIVEPIETKEFPTPATRPLFSLLNKNKIKHTFGLKIPHWRESLDLCLANLD
jgi:dTDP-4-dehydrorhamnose reductase